MAKTQMNVRIPIDIKREGDLVAARYGQTPSDVVRSVWSYMATYGQLPDCAKNAAEAGRASSEEFDTGQKQSAFLLDLARETGLPAKRLANVDRAQARNAIYEEMLEKREALDA